MNYKVVVVDDELNTREAIRKMISWNQEHCLLAGEASDGEEGLRLIKDTKPDIIITDIKMDQTEINGLDMVRYIRNLLPEAKLIVITGYRNFEYIQEALELGALGFILKPIPIDAFITVLRKAVIQLEYKTRRSEKIEELKKHFSRTLPILREKLLYDIIFQIVSNPEEVESNLELYEIALKEFILVLCEVGNQEKGDEPKNNKQLAKLSIANCFADIVGEVFTVYTVSLTQDRLLFIVCSGNPGLEFENDVYKKVEDLQNLVQTFSVNITVAVSTRGFGWKQLSEKTMECREAIEYKFYMGDGALILFEDLEQEVPPGDFTRMEKAGKDLVSAIRLGDEKKTQDLLLEINTFFSSNPNCPIQKVRYFYIQLIYEIDYLILHSARKNTWAPGVLHRELKMSTAISDFQSILKNLALELVRRANKIQRANINKIIRRAIDYIETNYQNNISLSEVAENSYASTYYICRMFKKETDKSFTDYLKEVRIDHAKELLKNPELKIYEVAEMVGFSDHHYFSKVFKEVTSISPSEFRQ